MGGKIVYHEKTADSGVSYDSTYATTSPAAGAASAAAGGEAGQAITLNKAPLYVSSTAKNKAGTKTGTYWLYDGILINGRYRVTNSAARCGKLPVGQNVTAGACELLHRQRGGEEVMAGTNRTGRVSAIDYKAGTYEVTYFDRGKSVTRQINAISNGEYKMPSIGQVVSVSHNSNGTAAGTTTGTVWNKTNTPAEGYKGLFRKEYAERKGLAYERYDENTGVYTQYVNRRTGRTCNGEIYDEAKGATALWRAGSFKPRAAPPA